LVLPLHAVHYVSLSPPQQWAAPKRAGSTDDVTCEASPILWVNSSALDRGIKKGSVLINDRYF